MRGLVARVALRAPVLALTLAVAFVAPRAFALEEPAPRTAEQKDQAARASFHAGELAEKERRYADALAQYRAVLATDPGNWFAAAARARVEVLAQYEGTFDELAKLDAVRKDPAKVDDRAAIEALEREALSFKGRARGEALLFVAEAWLGRLHEPSRAMTPALVVAKDPRVDKVLRDASWDLAWASSKNDLARAEREIAHDPDAPVEIRKRVLRDVRRARLHVASMGVVLIAGVAGVAAIGLSFARKRGRVLLAVATHPLALLFLVISPLFAAILADAWEVGFGKHFAPLATAMLAVHLLAAAWRGAFGDRGRAVRVAGGVLASVTVLAAAYLVLERSELRGTPLLTAFGL